MYVSNKVIFPSFNLKVVGFWKLPLLQSTDSVLLMKFDSVFVCVFLGYV